MGKDKKTWCEQEIDILNQFYPKHSNEHVQAVLNELGFNRTLNSINNNARLLGLKKAGRRKVSNNITYEERELLISQNKNYCNSCYETKGLSNFEQTQSMTLGFRNDCLDCRLEREKKNRIKKQPNIKCDFCDTPFYKYPSDISKNKNHFCSKECNKKWRSIRFTTNNINKPNYTDKDKNAAINLLKDGLTYSEIVESTDLTFNQVYMIRKNNNIDYIGKNKYKSDLHRKLEKVLNAMFPHNNIVSEYYIKETKQFIDLYDLDLNIAYEANGIQHYVQEHTWNRTDEAWELQQERDKRKIEYCISNNIPLVIVRYDEDVTEELIVFKLKEIGIDYEDVIKSSSFLLPTEEGDFVETKTVVNI